MSGPTRYLVFIKRDTDPWQVTPFRERAEAVAFVASAGAQWSETYLVEVLAGPRDVVGEERSLAHLAASPPPQPTPEPCGTCANCGGAGRVWREEEFDGGMGSERIACPTCGGTGRSGGER